MTLGSICRHDEAALESIIFCATLALASGACCIETEVGSAQSLESLILVLLEDCHVREVIGLSSQELVSIGNITLASVDVWDQVHGRCCFGSISQLSVRSLSLSARARIEILL